MLGFGIGIGWHIPEQTILSLHIWDDQAVVYNVLSGKTHLLNDLAYETLLLLQIAPEMLLPLVDKLCLIFDVNDKEDLTMQIQQLMDNFETLGLIEPIECEN